MEAILAIAQPKTKKQLRSFIGMVNFYRDVWPRRSELLAPLTTMTSKKAIFKWDDKMDKSFRTMKKIMARETLLAFPDFNKPFDIHTDASNIQLGAIISQDKQPIAFYSRKLNPAQTRYTTTEKELLSIVEVLKEFRTILLGQQIKVHTDHKNLVAKSLTSDRVMRWRLYIEEYSPDLQYIKGEDNHAADALSRLPMLFNKLEQAHKVKHQEQMSMEIMAEHFAATKKDKQQQVSMPVTYVLISTEQKHCPQIKKLLNYPDCPFQPAKFHGGGKSYNVLTNNNKIIVPLSLQQRTMEWYHDMLCHPGIRRMEETLRQHYWWPKMREAVKEYVKTCAICQRTKRKTIKYGKLPPKEAEAQPWDKLCIDLIGPYKIRRKNKPDLILKAATMIDPATGWFEICEYDDKRSITVANIVETQWLCLPWLDTFQILLCQCPDFEGKSSSDCLFYSPNLFEQSV